jgi:hypothetical protein
MIENIPGEFIELSVSEDCYLISGLEPAGQVTWRSWIGIIEETISGLGEVL